MRCQSRYCGRPPASLLYLLTGVRNRASKAPGDGAGMRTRDMSSTAFIASRRRSLSSEPKCNTPADLIIGTVDQDLRECCHAMLFAFVG
jgi:hypothetical protein